MDEQAIEEVGEVQLLPGCPGDFGEGEGSRKEHVLQVLACWDILGPEVALHAQHMPRLLGREHVWNGLVGIDGIQRSVAADGERLLLFGPLVVVEVDMRLGRHDNIVIHLRGGDSSLRANYSTVLRF